MGNRLRALTSRTPVTNNPVAGSNGPRPIDLGVDAQFDPTAGGWQLVDRAPQCNIWMNRSTGQQIQEYRIVSNDQFQFADSQKSFRLRFKSSTLVCSKFFKDETESQLCAKYYKGNLYLQRVPLRLSDIDQIPYPDVLHLYSQCFKGYAQLYDALGYFDVLEEMVCINKLGVVKVWANRHLDKYLPPVNFHNGTEREMVLKVVRIISQNTNQATLPDKISDWIIRSDPFTFRDAHNSLEGFASRYNVGVPQTLECVMNFMKMKYVEEEQEEMMEAPDLLMFDAPNMPQIGYMNIEQIIARGARPMVEPFEVQLPAQQNTVATAIAYSQQPVIVKTQQKRRILRHHQPTAYSGPASNPVVGRLHMASTPLSTQKVVTSNRIGFGKPIQLSQSPFKNILQNLQAPIHYELKKSFQNVAPQQHPLPKPESDRVHFQPVASVIDNSPYVGSTVQAFSAPYKPPTVSSGYGTVVNSNTNGYGYQPYPNEVSLSEGKSSPQIMAYIRSFSKISGRGRTPPHKDQIYPDIYSQSPSGAFYKDIGNTSHLVDILSEKVNRSVAQNRPQSRVQIIEETRTIETKSVYRTQEVGYTLMSIEQEVERDLRKFRSSKASKSSGQK